jgi:oligopeptide/dipeptide ABC transporter ATP-binding protein
VIERLCEETAVLYRGTLVEVGPTERLLHSPAHPYTQALRAAVPDIQATPRVRRADAAVDPDAAAEPTACPYAPRCPLAADRCRTEPPPLRWVDGRRVACHRAEEALRGP